MCKRVLKIILLVLVFVSVSLVVYAGNWVQDGNNWKFSEEGEFVTYKHKLIDGKWYLFDECGYMVTGLCEFDGKFYYYNQDGTPVSGQISYNNRQYTINGKGQILNINEEDFYAYKDSLSSAYIIGGGYDSDMSDLLNVGFEQVKQYFATLPLSKKAFRIIYKNRFFNDSAIEYMLNAVEINWKQQALKCAKEFYDKSQLNRVEMKSILLDEGFTEVEANYGTEMSFCDSALSTGVGKVDISALEKDYLDKMSMVILGEKISDIEARKKVSAETTVVVDNSIYRIVSKNKRTQQLNMVDDDAKNGKVKIKLTLPVPVLEGPNAKEVNKLINEHIFSETEKYLEYNYYEEIRHNLSYSAVDVQIDSQDQNVIVFKFFGDYDIEHTIQLNSMTFKNDRIK